MTGCVLRKALRGRAAFSAIVCHMPKLSPTHVEGVVSKWLVREGDAVEACDLVAHLDADDVYDGSDLTGRVTMLLETHDDGVIAELLVNEGEPRPAGAPIALIAEDAAGVDALKAAYRDCPDGADADAVASQLGARLMAWQAYLHDANEDA
jgi:pyruvate/2-oxoglutarate dehydrogenase complex dihydrolipoamide acyltransferase (E2) component